MHTGTGKYFASGLHGRNLKQNNNSLKLGQLLIDYRQTQTVKTTLNNDLKITLNNDLWSLYANRQNDCCSSTNQIVQFFY